MAISVYYELAAPESFKDPDVVRVLEATRKRAISQHFGVVSALNRQVAEGRLTFCIPSPFQTGGVIKVLPTTGFWFNVQLAHSSDSASVGLCRFPTMIRAAGREIQSGLGTGWHFQGSCRTQNPSQRNFDEFRKRHAGLVDLLATLQGHGVEADVEDDGDFWTARDAGVLEEKFRGELEAGPLLDEAFANALVGRAPERRPTLFASALRGQFLAQFTKRAK
ncbi:MAG: hypothetical protein JWM99_2280 [Verrucomicrobiales bacterium]|nr:hypothetical protein [Verrucomicrobiales bacterium]